MAAIEITNADAVHYMAFLQKMQNLQKFAATML